MKLRWTRPALLDLTETQDYIARDNPLAAQVIGQRIADAAQRLLQQPYIGRPGHVAGTRELVVDRSPYLIIYRIVGDDIELLRVWHGRRNWQDAVPG